MKPLRIIHTIDTHTAGEPTRVVIAGLPKLSGQSIAQKIDFFKKNYDHLRKALIFEPRGHSNMYGAVITSSAVPKAKFGIFFMCPRGYPMMCGHGTIGAVTALFEKGVSAVDFFGKPNNPIAHFKDIHVYGTGQIDRSPCGNGTCAMMANLYSKHKIGLNEDYIQEGISGDLFYGRIVDVVEIGKHTAIVPELKGSAFITGINQLIIDKGDPLKYGFSV
jgi:proline racemase